MVDSDLEPIFPQYQNKVLLQWKTKGTPSFISGHLRKSIISSDHPSSIILQISPSQKLASFLNLKLKLIRLYQVIKFLLLHKFFACTCLWFLCTWLSMDLNDLRFHFKGLIYAPWNKFWVILGSYTCQMVSSESFEVCATNQARIKAENSPKNSKK